MKKSKYYLINIILINQIKNLLFFNMKILIYKFLTKLANILNIYIKYLEYTQYI